MAGEYVEVDVKTCPDILVADDTGQESAAILIFMYSVAVSCSCDENRSVVHRCPSCFQYLKAFSRFGIAVRSKIPDDALSESFPLSMKGLNPLTARYEFIGSRSMSMDTIEQMQRFHRSILCWEHNATESFGYLSADKWTCSSHQGWSCLFPLTQFMIPDPCSDGSRTDLGTGLFSPTKEEYNKASVDRAELFRGCGDLDPFESWKMYLKRSADEAETLIKNLISQREFNIASMVRVYTDNNEQKQTELYIQHVQRVLRNTAMLPKRPGASYDSRSKKFLVDEFKGKVVSGRYGGMYIGLYDCCDWIGSSCCGSSHSLSRPWSYDFCKSVTLQSEKSYKNFYCRTASVSSDSNGMKDSLHSLKRSYAHSESESSASSVSFGSFFVSKGTLNMSEWSMLSKTKNDRLLALLHIAGNCTTVPLLTLGNTMDLIPSKTSKNAPQDIVKIRKQKQTLLSTQHRHAKVTYVLPVDDAHAGCQYIALGKATWYFVGLVAPTMVWRMSSILLAMEAKEMILTKVNIKQHAMQQSFLMKEAELGNSNSCVVVCDIPKVGSSKDKSENVSAGNDRNDMEQDQAADSLPLSSVSFPSAMLMLEAITPRMANENINSERLEVLGDSLLKFLTTVELYKLFPDEQEGNLTKFRSFIVSNEHLANQAELWKVAQYIRAIPLANSKKQLNVMPVGRLYGVQPVESVVANGDGGGEAGEGVGKVTSLWNEIIPLTQEDEDEYRQCHPNHSLASSSSCATQVGVSSCATNTTTDGVKSNISSFLPKRSKGKGKVLTAVTSNSSLGSVGSSGPISSKVTLNRKYLADAVEALVGAFYVQGGLMAGTVMMKLFNVWPNADTLRQAFQLDEKSHKENLEDDWNDYDSSVMGVLDGMEDEVMFDKVAVDSCVCQSMDTLYCSYCEYRDDAALEELMCYPSQLDMCEAHEGHGELDSAELMEGLDGVPDTEYVNYMFDRWSNWDEPLPPFGVDIMNAKVNHIYKAMGYRFMDMQLLHIALTHNSINKQYKVNGKQPDVGGLALRRKKDNERMEYLGDAVLEFAVVSELYSRLSWANPGIISLYKRAITNNKDFAQLSVALGLHCLMHVSSPILNNELLELRKVVAEMSDTSTPCVDSSGDSDQLADKKVGNILPLSAGLENAVMIPLSPQLENALADCFESLVGAIYLDSGESFSAIVALINRIELMPNM